MAVWPVITVADLADYLVGAQVTALRQAALAPGQTDPFDRVMPDRTNYIRNRVSNRIQVSVTPHAVPPELKTVACLLVLEAMIGRLRMELSEDQRSQIRRAYADLDIAGTDRFPISDPDDPISAPVQSGGHGMLVSYSPRMASRNNTRGL